MIEPRVSVVIPAFNAAKTIGRCLAALQGQRFDEPFEIIVVDDGSTDDTADVARAVGATVLTIPHARPAGARNRGVWAAHGAIVCCTDADCAPQPDWLRELTAPFADPTLVACKGTYKTRQNELVARFVQLEYEDKYDHLRSQSSIDFIDTYAAAYRRDALLGSGGFDTRFDYLEDQELSFRLAAAGCRMIFRETAVVDHLHSATLRAYLRKKMIIGYWKAQVVRRHPERIGGDSHTPPVMKAQMALAMLALAATVAGIAGIIIRPLSFAVQRALAFTPATLLMALFAATTLPFAGKAWRKDRPVAWLSPILLFGRAVALSLGYAWGVLRPRRGITPLTDGQDGEFTSQERPR